MPGCQIVTARYSGGTLLVAIKRHFLVEKVKFSLSNVLTRWAAFKARFNVQKVLVF